MSYTVIWLPDAEDELAAVWAASSRRAAVTRAANLLDRRLAALGSAAGESRPNNPGSPSSPRSASCSG